ncbi:chromosomal replication initiator protein DnaA [Candidatus Latescibacterota bacterium]
MDNTSSIDKNKFWENFLRTIEDSVNIQSFNTWFKPMKLLDISEQTILVSVPKAYFSSWIEEHYMPLLTSTSSSLLGRDLSFSFVSEDGEEAGSKEILSDSSVKEQSVEVSTVSENKPKSGYGLNFLKQLSINDRFSFDSFVVGNSSQFAHAASKAVADAPGTTAFNPLVIYGGVGLGKTHLLQAIAIQCLKSPKFINDKSKIIYVSSEKFTMDFIMYIQKNQVHEYSNFYRSADILLVDDIQFFNNKERTQEEFFHIFNTLHQQGKQIVLTMDKPPSQLKGLADRLINRFQWGLVTDIQPPDFETRVAILNKKAEADGVFLEASVAGFIAENVTTNIRELEGSLIRLLAYSSLYGRDISLDMASDVLGETFQKRVSLITIEYIQKLVSEHFSISLSSLVGNSRRKEVAVARHIAIYIAKQLTDSSLKTIGLHFGGRDHSTIIHSINNVEKKLLKDPITSTHIKTIIEKAKSS